VRSLSRRSPSSSRPASSGAVTPTLRCVFAAGGAFGDARARALSWWRGTASLLPSVLQPLLLRHVLPALLLPAVSLVSAGRVQPVRVRPALLTGGSAVRRRSRRARPRSTSQLLRRHVDDFDGFPAAAPRAGSHDITLYLDGYRTVPSGSTSAKHVPAALHDANRSPGDVAEPRPRSLRLRTADRTRAGGTQRLSPQPPQRGGPPPRPQGPPRARRKQQGIELTCIRRRHAVRFACSGERPCAHRRRRWTDRRRRAAGRAGLARTASRGSAARRLSHLQSDIEVRPGETSTVNVSLSRP